MLSGSNSPMLLSNRQALSPYRMSTSSSSSGPFTSQQTPPSFLFGSRSKRRSMILPSESTSSVQLASEDINAFVSPLSARNQYQGSKSVHWSPSLVQTQETNLSTGDDYMDIDLQKLPATGAVNGPPLRSIRDELLSPHQPVSDPFAVPSNTSSATDVQNPQETGAAALWVTVFGFSREDAANVLKLFSRHGTITAHRCPREGNWMYLRYASPIHAQQALSRNGHIVDGRLRLGVVPLNQQELATLESEAHVNSFLQFEDDENNSQLSQNRSLLSENSMLCGVTPLASMKSPTHPLDTNFSPSLISAPLRPGIRSLQASYNVMDNYYRVNGGQQPEKSHGLLDKLWNFIS